MNTEPAQTLVDPQQEIDTKSLQFLAAAAQGYLDKAQDELGRTCIAPQMQLALNNLSTLIDRHYDLVRAVNAATQAQMTTADANTQTGDAAAAPAAE